MKKIILLVLSLSTFCGYISAQNLMKTNDELMFCQLPLTSDDFQHYMFDYPLENALSVYNPGALDVHSSLSRSFLPIGLHPFEHNCPVSKIECILYKKGRKQLSYGSMATYDKSGQILDFKGKYFYNQQHVYDVEWWTVEGKQITLTPCAPNPYINYIKPTRNEKGLITNVGKDLIYLYDSEDRVKEIKQSQGTNSYRYTYLPNSKKIKSIEIYFKDGKGGEVIYTYENGKIIGVNAKIINLGIGSTYKEYIKKYRYDSHNKICYIEHIDKMKGVSEFKKVVKIDNNYDDNNRINTSHITIQNFYNGKSNGAPASCTHNYTYDSKGNWIKVEDGEHIVERTISY